MKKNRFSILGVLAVLLAFGLVYSSCGPGAGNDDPDTVATPTATPGTGAYSAAQTVTLATTTDGAKIYYTTDNSTPSASNGTAYTAPISVTIPSTLKAIAVKGGWDDSGVLTANYTELVVNDDLTGTIWKYTDEDETITLIFDNITTFSGIHSSEGPIGGTYTVTGNTVTINFTVNAPPDGSTWTGTVAGDSITFTNGLTFVKQDGTNANKLIITGIDLTGVVTVLITTNLGSNPNYVATGTGTISDTSITIQLMGVSGGIVTGDWTDTGDYYIMFWNTASPSGGPIKVASVIGGEQEKISFTTETTTVAWSKFGTGYE
ncbi:chitobiase/beta-hexosaminidase C-terminal domain-containing protein [Treponema primitia]|uniref:chitobiase/beta-hexosaminidase C-terminal domain-containing protein n=1 Tax=Treponema primitia TaxID=88058 RepID=UPI00397EC2AE